MVWETFEGRNRRQPGVPSITISKAGNLALNCAIVRNVLKGARFATLMFDRDRQLVGIKLEGTSNVHNYPIKLTGKGNGAQISGVAFLKAYNIFPKETCNYLTSLDQQTNTIVFEINTRKKKA